VQFGGVATYFTFDELLDRVDRLQLEFLRFCRRSGSLLGLDLVQPATGRPMRRKGDVRRPNPRRRKGGEL
jgi:hypothetical protein